LAIASFFDKLFGLKVVILGAALCVGLGCVAPLAPVLPPFENKSFASCLPEFPYKQGWLGGDAAYSVPLSEDGRSLWLFGDSFISPSGGSTRESSALIHNSIAISRCDTEQGWQIDYFWNANTVGEPKDFFPSLEPGKFYWPFDGELIDDILYVGLLVAESSDPQPPLGLPFVLSGMKLARVANWRDEPHQWQAEIATLSRSTSIFPGSAMVLHDGFLYLYSFRAQDSKRALVRIRVEDLQANFQELTGEVEQFTRDGTWEEGLSVANAAVLMDDAATEMSVNFHIDLQRWVAVYSTVAKVSSSGSHASSAINVGSVVMRQAEELQGPWSRPVELIDPGAKEAVADTFCYAGKEHAQFSTSGSLVISYVCNLLPGPNEDPLATLTRLMKRMDLYRPEGLLIQKDKIPQP